MAEEGTAGPGTTEGQAAEGSQATPGTTQSALEGSEGQSGTLSGTTDEGTQTADDTFFDPASIPPELVPAYKNMQRAFSKKMEHIKTNRQKIEAFDAFNSDPVGQLQDIARRYGYSLSRAEAAQQIANQQPGNGNTAAWEPKSWDEVLDRAEERAYNRLMQENQPMLREVQNLRKSNLETFLDNNAPDWRQYEDEMMETIKQHPSLVNNPLQLYKLSVPDEVLQSRATQAAIKKMQEKTQGAQVHGSSTTTRKGPEGIPDKPLTFDEAVKFAQSQLAKEGIRPPGR